MLCPSRVCGSLLYQRSGSTRPGQDVLLRSAAFLVVSFRPLSILLPGRSILVCKSVTCLQLL